MGNLTHSKGCDRVYMPSLSPATHIPVRLVPDQWRASNHRVQTNIDTISRACVFVRRLLGILSRLQLQRCSQSRRLHHDHNTAASALCFPPAPLAGAAPPAECVSGQCGEEPHLHQVITRPSSALLSGRRLTERPSARTPEELDTLTLLSAASNRPLITLWTASWCKTCANVKPVVRSLIEDEGVGEVHGGLGYTEVELDSVLIGDLGMRYMVRRPVSLRPAGHLRFDALTTRRSGRSTPCPPCWPSADRSPRLRQRSPGQTI